MLDTILTIIQIAPWVISGASLICALTPTPKDDQIIGKIYKLIDWCAINVGRAKEKQMSFWNKVVDFWTGTERKKIRARDEDGRFVGDDE